MSLIKKEWDHYCAQYGIPERIEVMLCDCNSILRGKWLPGSEFEKLLRGDVRLPLSTYVPSIFGCEVEETGLGIVAGDPDGILIPVAGSLHPVPWAEGNVAQILVEMSDESGEISPLSSRQALARTVERLETQGLFAVVATELEFYILQPRDFSQDAPLPPEGLPQAQNYELEVLSMHELLLTDMINAAAAQGLPTDTLIAEYGPGQFEINFHHVQDPLLAADYAVMFRRLVRGVAAKHGLEATFMAKPYAENPGSGMHAHVSILDAQGQNIFIPDQEGHTHPLLLNAVGGVLASMAELQAIFAPHMNSYRRFQVNSFAPTAPVWGFDNRAAAVRLPETQTRAARLEHRICGADVNPYLALAAILTGMEIGIDQKTDPGPSLEEMQETNATPLVEEKLSHDWITAVERFAASPLSGLVMGDTLRDVYVILRQYEIAQMTTQITPQEYATYLSRL